VSYQVAQLPQLEAEGRSRVDPQRWRPPHN